MTIYGAVPRGAYRQMPKGNPRSLGFERYLLGFNGSGHYIQVPDSPTIRNLYMSPFTIELAARTGSLPWSPDLQTFV